MRLLTERARIVGFGLVGAVLVLGTTELAFGERSIADVGVVGLLAAISIGALAILRWTTQSLRLSELAQKELAIRLSQQHTVARLGQHALTDVSRQDILEEAVAGVADQLRTEMASVLEVDLAQQVLTPRANVGAGAGESVPAGSHSLAGYALEAGVSVVMPDAANETRFEISEPMRKHGIVSGVTTPIGSNGGTYGVLCVQTRQPRTFSDNDVTFLEAVASVLASAIGRRTAEENAEQAHQVLEAVIEGTSDDIFVKDLEGRFVAVNASAAETLGRSSEDLVGRMLSDVLPAEYAESMMMTDQRVLEHGVVETFEESVPGGNGRRVVLATKGPYRARDGTVLGTFGIARDITLRKAQEQEIARSEERFRLAQEGARMGTWDVDLTNGVTTWSTGLRALFGVGPDYPAGLEHLAPLLHPDDRARVMTTASDAYANGDDFDFEFRIVQPDGTRRWILSRASTYHADDGTIIRILGVAVDITERKAAEEELERSEATLQHAQAAAGLGAWDWNLETDELHWSPAMYSMLGLDPAVHEPSYGTLSQFIHPEDLAVFDAAVQRCLASGEPHYESLCRIVRPSGAVRWLINRGTIIRRDDGKAIRVIGISLDDTDRRQVDARLRQGEKLEAIGRLAGGVAHDFNNLLVAINGYGELALRRLERGEHDVAGNIGAVLAAADRAAGLTRQLLAFGRRQVLSLEILDLNEVVRDTVGLLERVIGDNVELVTGLARRPVIVKADRGQLEQVITNLAVNGRDAMPSGGVLTIHVGTRLVAGARIAQLTVTDEGSGIDAATAGHIFEPFFTTKGDEGTGLGLATVHGIVEQSGGQVLLDTELGRGTTFDIRLPLCEEQPMDVPLSSSHATPRGGETILVVEDDPAVRSIVTVMLEELGYEIVEAVSGEEAVGRFETHDSPISLVLSDVMMRGLNGRETIGRIRERAPATRVLYMSGYTDDANIECEELGSGTGFIQKPFSGDELGSRVRELLDSRIYAADVPSRP